MLNKAVVMVSVTPLFIAGLAGASPIEVPSDGADFGEAPFDVEEFGGSGIPTDPIAWTQSEVTGGALNFALGAHSRRDYSAPAGAQEGPAVTDDGNATYFTTPGTTEFGNTGDEVAGWNFNFYASAPVLWLGREDTSIELRVDTSPGSGTLRDDHLVLPISDWILESEEPIRENETVSIASSQNLMFNWLETAGDYTFDPFATGEYTFELAAFDTAGETASVSMAVEVGTVPEPGTWALFGLGIAGIAGISLLRRRESCPHPTPA